MPKQRTFVCSAAMTRRFPSSPIKSSLSLTLPETKFRSRQQNREKSFNRFTLTILWLHKAHEPLHKPWMLSPPQNSFTAQAVCFAVLSECLFLANSVTSSLVRLAHRLSTRSRGSNVGSSSRWALAAWHHPAALFLKTLFKCTRHSWQTGELVPKRSQLHPGVQGNQEVLVVTEATSHCFHQARFAAKLD